MTGEEAQTAADRVMRSEFTPEHREAMSAWMTVARSIITLPAADRSPPPFAAFSASMKGMR